MLESVRERWGRPAAVALSSFPALGRATQDGSFEIVMP